MKKPSLQTGVGEKLRAVMMEVRAASVPAGGAALGTALHHNFCRRSFDALSPLCTADPDIELCELPEISKSVPPPERSAVDEAWSRGRWLLGLLLLQSLSSFVLDSYQQLLRDHTVVVLFLTMLVGAGGNAGNQSAIKVRCCMLKYCYPGCHNLPNACMY